jgi:hypothetical protein
MTTLNLISKLNKINIAYSIIDHNGYNKDIAFSINGLNFKAGFSEGKTVIEDFCREICFDNNTQEMQRRFFGSFNQLLKYANVKL